MKFQRLLVLHTVLLAGVVFAASPVKSKVYRNEEYGFEIRYPGDMNVVTSATAASRITSADNTPDRWQKNDIVHVRYDKGLENVWARIELKPAVSASACHPEYPTTVEGKINGFTQYQQEGDGALGKGYTYHDFSTMHNGNCVLIRAGALWVEQWHESEEGQATIADSESHLDQMTEIVKSFRFLNGKPKTK